jgi:hypothetical protein
MLFGKVFQDLLTGLRQNYDDLPTVAFAGPAMDHTVRLHSVDQFHGAVMANLQALGQIADGGAKAVSVESPYGQQQLVLLRFQAQCPRRFVAEMLKLADLVAELRERLELFHR